VRQHAIGAEYLAARLRGLEGARSRPLRASRIDADEGAAISVSPSRATLRSRDDAAGDRPRCSCQGYFLHSEKSPSTKSLKVSRTA